jgi:hypothetical protein
MDDTKGCTRTDDDRWTLTWLVRTFEAAQTDRVALSADHLVGLELRLAILASV